MQSPQHSPSHLHVSGSSLRRQLFFWIGALAVFILFLLAFSSILLPFVAGMTLSYFLDPVTDWLERRGLSRLMASILIFVSFVLVFALSRYLDSDLYHGRAASLPLRQEKGKAASRAERP